MAIRNFESYKEYYEFYKNLEKNVLKPTASQEDINALGEWLAQYGDMFYNGEYYSADEGVRLYPVYREEKINDQVSYEFIKWEIR